MALARFTKDPDAVLDYVWDWTAWLDGDLIDTATFIPDAGITVDSSAYTTTTATAWLSGGTPGKSHKVVCRITTTGGRTDDRTISLRIAHR